MPPFRNPKPPLDYNSMVILTTEVEVNGCRHLSILVLGLNLVHASILFLDIVQHELDIEDILLAWFDGDGDAPALLNVNIPSVPIYLRFGRGKQLAVEDELVAVVLLTKFGLLGEARGEVFPRGPHRRCLGIRGAHTESFS